MNAVTSPILSVITFLPVVGVLFILSLPRTPGGERNARHAALYTTLFTFGVSLLLWINFDSSTAQFQFVEDQAWFGASDDAGSFRYRMGVDGISMLFVILTTFLMPLCILASWESIKYRVKEYMIAFLLLETMMIGVFCALDLMLFYIFFEAGLIPMYLIIGVWGGKRRVYASYKFFLYTLLGSVLMLLAVLWMYDKADTTDIRVLLEVARTKFTLKCSGGCGWLFLLPSRSSCPCGPSIPGCPTHTSKRRRRVRLFWRVSC